MAGLAGDLAGVFIQLVAMIVQFGQIDWMRLVAMAGLAGGRVACQSALPRMWAPPLSIAVGV